MCANTWSAAGRLLEEAAEPLVGGSGWRKEVTGVGLKRYSPAQVPGHKPISPGVENEGLNVKCTCD